MARLIDGMRLKVALLALALPLAACKQQPSSEMPGAVNAERIIAANPDEWLSYGRTYDEQRHSPLDQINQTTIKDLGLAWFADLDTARVKRPRPWPLMARSTSRRPGPRPRPMMRSPASSNGNTIPRSRVSGALPLVAMW